MIGRLQTNKVKYIVDKVACIQSVDSIKLAGEISRLSVKTGRRMPVLVEVNIGGEENKGGVPPREIMNFGRDFLFSRYSGRGADGNSPDLCR